MSTTPPPPPPGNEPTTPPPPAGGTTAQPPPPPPPGAVALGTTGQTWGRKIVGVKVIDASTGAPIGVWRALGRQLFEGTISSWLFYLGFWWMLWDPQNQTWHDKAVNSVVVKL